MPISRKHRSTTIAAIGRLLAALALCVGALLPAAAEPYLAVFKGMQCSQCHSHPAGGGKRTVYGNVFSQTELPAARLGDDSDPLWTGEVREWLSVGANLRSSYQHIDTPGEEKRSAFDVTRGTVYAEATVIPNRLTVYVDQQIAPNASLNREAYVKVATRSRSVQLVAGQFYLPYGLRLQDDTAFIRQATGINFTNPDRGVQLIYEGGPWSTQLSLTNGTGGGPERDTGKQASWVAAFVRPGWRAGFSFNFNDADVGDRQMQNVFAGLKTGPIAWLLEADLIIDEVANGERESVAGLVEGNWRPADGHNLKVTYEYLDPDTHVDEDHQVRWSALWEYFPFQFVQSRIGVRTYDGIPQENRQNRDELFAELHGYF